MPDFEVNIYLSNGSKATLKLENFNATAISLEQNIQNQLLQPGENFRFSSTTAVISLKKHEMIGFSIDQL